MHPCLNSAVRIVAALIGPFVGLASSASVLVIAAQLPSSPCANSLSICSMCDALTRVQTR
jgi:hypothetical protein